MSKKKDRKIKRLQRLAIWPAIVEMFIAEFIIFALTIFICALSVFGIINTLILTNAKECRTVVKFVNENWDSMSREQLEQRLSDFTASYSDIDGIFIDDKNDVPAIFPKLKNSLNDEAQRLLDTTDEKSYIIAGMVGYEEPNYFSYVFKKHFGVSPSKYRQ